jgi:D-alanyl-D-alanine carboxypeptidase (penicillin-binding protein 5/6)
VQIAAGNDVIPDMMQTSAIRATTSERSAWEVQIAAADSQRAALSLLRNARPSIASSYSGIAPYTEAVKSGSATLYRARFTGFDSQAAALSACKNLKAHSYSCVVMANES